MLWNRLSTDLGFSPGDRAENVRRAPIVTRLMADAGQAVLVALISPRADDRRIARATCQARDPEGLYAAARVGRLSNFTGVLGADAADLVPLPSQ